MQQVRWIIFALILFSRIFLVLNMCLSEGPYFITNTATLLNLSTNLNCT